MTEKIGNSLNEKPSPRDIVVSWINQVYKNQIAHALRDQYLLALEQNDKEKIEKLAHRLEIHIGHIREKRRDTPEDMGYVKNLEDGLAYLRNLTQFQK